MNGSPDRACRISTERLLLRPTRSADSDRAFEIQSDWEVTRMLRLASFPPNRDEIRVWFDRVGWGQGYGFEAAGAVVRFAFGDASLSTLRSSYAADNIASKKLLLKLGFRPVSTVRRVSRSRGEQITQVRYVLMKPPGGDKTTSKV